MTVLAVVTDPPREGLVLPDLADSSPLTEREAADLYAAMVKDTIRAAERSGGDVLVNYRPDDLIPEEFHGEQSAEAEVRALAKTALESFEDARFEKQVGSTFSARVGNTVTHLLEQEEVQSAAVVDGLAPTLTRKDIDSAAMKLRRNEVVLGPSERGRVFFAGFTDTIDFEDAYQIPELETLTHRAVDAGHEVDYLPQMPTVETGDDLLTLVSLLESRVTAGRVVPEHTATLLDELNLRVRADDGERMLVRE
ncbi:TIGR04282 family arsenosugar biosynthesis glycosyltransferase [Halorussus halophilus]|uniref:TIGR04282 family arsenosugar biosynthesis glycosyltransferase n=1 Tax=Halorussus halophilus TaxID=2650975 RepID=UPI0013015DD5|nr:DUF2064 domain-containing protein [Halorussus halophilus]